jgi:hypothetical protein
MRRFFSAPSGHWGIYTFRIGLPSSNRYLPAFSFPSFAPWRLCVRQSQPTQGGAANCPGVNGEFPVSIAGFARYHFIGGVGGIL